MGHRKGNIFSTSKRNLEARYLHFLSKQQENLIGLLRARATEAPITLGGDGRCDSMGHCAKYGICTCIEMAWNCVLDIRVVASTEVGGSHFMELEGLKRSLGLLTDWLDIKKLVTHRHCQISKWMR